MSSDTTRKQEVTSLMYIALPLVAAYLAEFAMFLTTKMVVGKLGYLELAAVGISSSLSFEILVIMMGLLSIVGVLCAQAEGAGMKDQAGLAVKQGLILSLILGIPAAYLIWNLDWFLHLTGQDPQVIELSVPYLRAISTFVFPILFFSVMRSFVSALAKPKSVMVITVVAVAINYGLTYWFVHGGLGLPALGLTGAGLATNIVSWLMFIALTIHIYRVPLFRGYGVFKSHWNLDYDVCREIIVLGVPVAGLVLLEAGMFVAASVLSGAINAETLAAYEIVGSWIGIPFVIAMGIPEATMIRVAYGVGRDNLKDARQSGMLGMALGIGVLSTLIIVPLVFPTQIIRMFISPDDQGFDLVSALAIQFFVIAALFQVFDGLQAIAARALRGLKDSVVPLWIAGFGYWVLGIGGGALLAFHFNLDGEGIWWGMALGLMTTGSMLAWRFNGLSQRRIQQHLSDA